MKPTTIMTLCAVAALALLIPVAQNASQEMTQRQADTTRLNAELWRQALSISPDRPNGFAIQEQDTLEASQATLALWDEAKHVKDLIPRATGPTREKLQRFQDAIAHIASLTGFCPPAQRDLAALAKATAAHAAAHAEDAQ